MLTGTQAPKTTHVVRIFESIVVKDLPIYLRLTQGSDTLGSWTLDTLDQFGFELEDLLIEQQQIGLPDFQPSKPLSPIFHCAALIEGSIVANYLIGSCLR